MTQSEENPYQMGMRKEEFGTVSALGRGTPKLLWMTWAGHGTKLFRNFLSFSKTFTAPQREIMDKIRGELKVSIRRLKITCPHFLISFAGDIISKHNYAEVGMSVFLRLLSFSCRLLGLDLLIGNLNNFKSNSLLPLQKA